MLKSFDESHAAVNPFDQFKEWWEKATSADIDEVNAMTWLLLTEAENQLPELFY